MCVCACVCTRVCVCVRVSACGWMEVSACGGGMVEGTAVTESLHKWNTTPSTIASHKPELWCKCFSNMAWIYPCTQDFKKKMYFSLPQTEKPEKVVQSMQSNSVCSLFSRCKLMIRCISCCLHSFLFGTGLPIKALKCWAECGWPIEVQIKAAEMHSFYIVSHAESHFASSWRVKIQ